MPRSFKRRMALQNRAAWARRICGRASSRRSRNMQSPRAPWKTPRWRSAPLAEMLAASRGCRWVLTQRIISRTCLMPNRRAAPLLREHVEQLWVELVRWWMLCASSTCTPTFSLFRTCPPTRARQAGEERLLVAREVELVGREPDQPGTQPLELLEPGVAIQHLDVQAAERLEREPRQGLHGVSSVDARNEAEPHRARHPPLEGAAQDAHAEAPVDQPTSNATASWSGRSRG